MKKKSTKLLYEAEIERIKEDYNVDVKNIVYYEPMNMQFLVIPDKYFIKECKKSGRLYPLFFFGVIWTSCLLVLLSGIIIVPLLLLTTLLFSKKKGKVYWK